MLEFFDTSFQGFHDCRAVRFDDAVEQHRDLAINFDDLALHGGLALGG